MSPALIGGAEAASPCGGSLGRRTGVRALCLAALVGGILAAPGPAAAGTCGSRPYSYAGFQGALHARSVTGTIGLRRTPRVTSGHVMAWVGVGGPGEGPGGADAWLQVGIGAVPGSEPELYYEVQQPGLRARYRRIAGPVRPGERHRVGVLETPRPNRWRVVVDGRAASPVFLLPGSHGRWYGDAEAESWNGGRAACNRFDFTFEHVVVGEPNAREQHPLIPARLLQDAGYRVIGPRPGAFAATSVAL